MTMLERVVLSEVAIEKIVKAAIEGYEAPYKEERLGILLGRVSGDIALVKRAVVYGGGERRRTSASVDQYNFERRVKDLQKESDLSFLGSFHTHVEINGSISSAPSPADKIPLCDDPPSLIEIIACVWAGDGTPRPSNYFLQVKYGGYRCRMSGRNYEAGFRILPVFSEGAKNE
jgi:hypothetical protein